MAESTGARTHSPDGGPVERALRATAAAADVALLQAYRDFIAHSETCQPCRATGCDCDEAAQLRQAWRDARTAAAH